MPSPTRQQIGLVMRDLASRLPLEGKDVLDIGTAGNPKEGENREWFGGKAKSYKTLDKLEELNPDIVADIADMPQVPSDSFDVVICSQVIEHVKPQLVMRAVREMKRILRKDGILILDSPGRAVPYHPEPGFDHYGWFTATGLMQLLDASGFKVIADESKQSDLLCLAVGEKE